MQVLKDKTDKQLLESLLAESAKASNELKCAQADVAKASSRLSFVVLTVNELLQRSGD